MLQLLQELRADVSAREQQRIDNIVASTQEDVAEAASSLQRSPDKGRDEDEDEDEGGAEGEGEGEGEANVSAEVGSNEDLDNMNEDLMRTEQSRATGYMGKNTETQWLRRVHREADSAGPPSQGPYGPPGDSSQAHDKRVEAMHQRHDKTPILSMDTSSCSFYLDEDPLNIDFLVDAYELPPFPIAENLFKCYMSTVQNSFPFLSGKLWRRSSRMLRQQKRRHVRTAGTGTRAKSARRM
ncbi:hypothetical protein BU23DRAFT_115199 [Bimuria novae-zelandiae CBS 107.79]|uniref:Uncharacterized protein n=1 Tax=Bimuria novae-zelandiae CBS 107.79 TaxID=1447943 RepID=A0A6A5VB26_9PLEO|nr:hypothetical protein BU23DRAFT_115199 [Bimuria novae-zelandiae CBS 107.79]